MAQVTQADLIRVCEDKNMITGYGKGWQEPKATTRFGRFRQIMREPATTKAYIAAAFFWWAVITTVLLLITG